MSLLLLLAQAATLGAANHPVDAPIAAPRGAPSFADEFSGAAVDQAKWRFDTAQNPQGWPNHELQYYGPQNARIERGALVIEARREPLTRPDERMSYAYQLDSTLYGRFLRAMAEGDGAHRVEGRIAQVELKGDTGDIAALTLDSGVRIEGDLFLDCTGFRALLIEGALHAGYDDWMHYLPCDSAIAVQTESVRPPVPFTRAMAHDAGWQWRIPLQHRVGNGIVYCSRYLDGDTALERLLGNVEGRVLTEPNRLRFVTGARRRQWHRNCIAIGLAGGFMEPLESTSIHLIQRAILRLIRMLPQGTISPADVAEFNEQQMQDMLQIRDFLILHYKATERRDSAFWRQCAAMDVPETLAQRIALFRDTGRVFRKNDELFAENSWVQVMMGQGILPAAHHPLADKLSDDELARLLATLREGVAGTVATLPAHDAYVAHYCRAPRAAA